ncbi:MAG: bifunctional UDP-N-acetylglucosamine diphosphorylase/glucosamine-1-phosphate N-acetyltransferase GlmU [Sulfurimonas sp.]|uniref:bifunctional UDP-N-acetylglucosamine diphosphorylase/glucosamine-1-phosphate N-acetyltransferase GlmU n=1 Tax=Sulfurimonas sp. TaxID=2022749 RepID=UPI0025D81E86|nr:bifunctional UDP-N-acetylglucosamine diphosphorylase/glucosamine-1-phosphate N-acetyltransferase GlmU [Sulfurimonas sp.]MCK9490536.1 bifunctional UDP-N-acetylglucosamine diphosphorylase/glucosamine-1-phosphate N-acetyltransferase GlmU [Sulfurimonas sp.]
MNKKDLSIVILAAGKGSRMKSNKAKVLHHISGKPMLYHIIKTSQEISNDITIVVAHQKDEVIKEISKFFTNINFVTQDAQNFPGTGGAMMNILPKYESVLVLNGDMPLISADALSGFLNSNAQIIMSIFELGDPSGYGRVIIENGEVLKIVEHKDANKDELKVKSVNAGVYAFSSSVLKKYIPLLKNDNAQKEYYLTDIISLAKADSISIVPLLVDEEHFRGVNSKEDLAECEVIMQERIKSHWMREGVIMQLPNTIYIEESVKFEGECKVENNCRITGDTLISNSHIKSSSVIEDSRIIDSDVGPLAHIRPMSQLKDTHIGNFVEVKKSSLIGVKAGHLSYIGDAQVDEGTNIGAGVITCNYDGVNKYKTIIGKNVFIGSDSQLIAPLVVEDDVMIAAGTTVTAAKIQSGVLAISRTKLTIVKDFYYKFFRKV